MNIFAKIDKGIKKANIFKKIIRLGLLKIFMEIIPENRNNKIPAIKPVDNEILVDNENMYCISLSCFLPLYQGINLSNPSGSPIEAKTINHPETIIAKENSP